MSCHFWLNGNLTRRQKLRCDLVAVKATGSDLHHFHTHQIIFNVWPVCVWTVELTCVCSSGVDLGWSLPVCVPAAAAGRGSGAHVGEARLWCETRWVWPDCNCAGNQSQALTGWDQWTDTEKEKGRLNKWRFMCCEKIQTKDSYTLSNFTLS